MNYEIQPLPVEKWKGHKIPFCYTSSHYYEAEITQSDRDWLFSDLTAVATAIRILKSVKFALSWACTLKG